MRGRKYKKRSDKHRKNLSKALTGRPKKFPNSVNPNSGSYTVTYPNGKQIDILGLRQFCISNGLRASGMQAVLEGRCTHHKGFKCVKNIMKNKIRSINDKEREDWVNSDEGLYNMWLGNKCGLTKFVRAHRAEIDEVINNVLGNKKPAHYLAYPR